MSVYSSQLLIFGEGSVLLEVRASHTHPSRIRIRINFLLFPNTVVPHT